jgi:hypothetical protein
MERDHYRRPLQRYLAGDAELMAHQKKTTRQIV